VTAQLDQDKAMPYLDLDQAGIPMKRVYQLSEKLKNDPGYVAKVQALTLDINRPLLGLKGTHGLYGSPEWWKNIEQRKMPTRHVSGIIQRAYVAGQDGGDENNSVDLLLEDASVFMESIYVNDKKDVALFRKGCLVEIFLAFDELKRQPASDGGINYSDNVIEMAVSLEPVTSD
jgi:hypothetical protein